MADLVRFPRAKRKAVRPVYEPRLGPWVPLILSFAVAGVLKFSMPQGAPSHFALEASAPVEIAGPASVIDGDTIAIAGTHIRFFGIDAPERSQLCRDGQGRSYACGTVASEALANLMRGQTVRCNPQEIDRYGRPVAICNADGKDLGEAMVDSGLALALRHYSHSYVPNEERAQRDHRGLWAGSFELPEDYRHEGQ